MNKYLKTIPVLLALTSSVYLPSVNAANSTDMLITIAETNPVLVERLNEVALNDSTLLNQLLTMADSDPAKLERLLNLAETNPEIFEQIVTVFNTEKSALTGIGDGGVIRT
jgi:hypothetical protein